jgi:hypothetical protein
VVHWASHAGTRDFCSALAALVSIQNILFLSLFHFISFVIIAQQAGQAAVLGQIFSGPYFIFSCELCLCPEQRLPGRGRVERGDAQQLREPPGRTEQLC